MSVKLSTQLIATSVGVLAVEGAFVTYAFTSRQVGVAFVLLAALAAACFVASILCAGRGISKARDAGYEGRWSLQVSRKEFNRQALANFGALFFLLAAFVVFLATEPRADRTVQASAAVTSSIEKLADQVARIRVELQNLRSTVAESGRREPAPQSKDAKDAPAKK